MVIILVLFQVVLFITTSILFSLNKDKIHHSLEDVIGKDVFHGDSLSIADLDYSSTLFLQPKIDLKNVKIWGLGAKHLTPAFDIRQLSIEVSWTGLAGMLWEASEWGGEKILNIRNEKVRVNLKKMHLLGGTLTMTRSSKGHNHRLFRPPNEKIQKFASGELKMAGGFEIKEFIVQDLSLNYFKDKSRNEQEALPKKYDVYFDYLKMKMSSDSVRAYFEDFYAEGTINSISVKNNEGLVGRAFKADGTAQLLKLSLDQKIKNDTGFDLVSNDFNVQFNDLKASVSGVLSTLNEKMRMDIDFRSVTGMEDKKNEALLSFLDLTLSDRFLDIIKSYDPLGELEFVGKVSNKDNEFGGAIKIALEYIAKSTSFQFQFFENGKRHRIENLELTGQFEVGGDSPSYISADISEGELYDGQTFQGKIILDNVFRREFLDSLEQIEQPPLAEVRFNSLNIDFHRLLEFMEFQKYDVANGSIDFRNFHFSGPIASLSQSYRDLSYGGDLRLRNVQFESSKLGLPVDFTLKDTNGSIVFSNNRVSPKMGFTFNNYPIEIRNGSIRDFVPYIFNEARERLYLKDFDIHLGDIEASTLIKDIQGIDFNSKSKLSDTLVSKLLDKVIRNIKAENLRVSIPNLNINGLYQMPDVTNNFPQDLDDLSFQGQLDINQLFKLSLRQSLGPDTIDLGLKLTPKINGVGIDGTFNTNIHDLSDWACKLGIDVTLGVHNGVPLQLQSHLKLKGLVSHASSSIILEGNGTKLSNEQYGINAEIKRFESSLLLNSYQLASPSSAHVELDLGGEPIIVDIKISNDSINIKTPNTQKLDFANAQKYLSLICEIDQNLSRLDNLSGALFFSTALTKSLKATDTDFLLTVDRKGSIEIKDLAFDFIKEGEPISFRDIGGDFSYDNEGVSIHNFNGNYETSDFRIFDTEVEDILGFILLGDPLVIDTLHLESELLDLTTILGSRQEYQYECADQNIAIVNPDICLACIEKTKSTDSSAIEQSTPIGFSLLNFLKTSTVKYADAFIERILFSPISGSESFEIDDLSVSGHLDASRFEISDLQARMYDGLIFQYQPLQVWVKNEDTLAIEGAYTVENLELHEVIEKLDFPSIDALKTDKLDFRGKLKMDFDFIDTLTSSTDINTLEFRINKMQILEGSAKELSIVGMENRWKENVGPIKRFAASLLLGNFKKKFERPTRYVFNLENLLLDTGWVTYDVLEFYNNQINLVSTGTYEIESGNRDVDLLLQRSVKGYDYTEFSSTYCKKGFLTYFNVQNDPAETVLKPISSVEQSKRAEAFERCMNNCPCNKDDCLESCIKQNPTLNQKNHIPNDVSYRMGNKRLKAICD